MGKGKKMITLRELKEKAVSKQQQKLMGLALAYKRGDVPEDEVSDTVRDLAKSMSTKELEKFAGTKHKGLPDKVDEGKSSTGYELYHRDFSSAMQHAYKHAKSKLGVDVDPKEIDKKVAMGPRKPSKGKTNSYRLLDKDGKKAIQVQVYGMDNGKYELNMYKESVDINEAFSDSQIAKLKKEYEPLRTKRISLDHNKKLNSIIDKISHNKDALEKLYKADIPFVSQTASLALIMKHNYKAADLNNLVESVEELEERYSGKQVKMAMGIASDPRYKQGNYSGAVKQIEKIAKGLSKHPSVASHLKKMNEDGHTDVDSSERMCKTVTEDAKEILEYLDGMEGEGSLPTWWTNKLATASKDMNSLRDYLVNPDDEKKDMKEYLEVGTDEIRKSYAKATPGQTNELATGTDRAIALGAIGATAYAAKKAKDRFDPVKVAKARQDRADKRKARQDAQDQIRQQNKARRERMRDRFKSKPARRPAG